MTTRLSGLQIDEVSLVKRAANGRKRFLILKADGHGEDDMRLDETKALETIEKLDKADLGSELEALAGADVVELKTVIAKAADLNEVETRRVKAALRILGKDGVEKFVKLLTPEPAPAPIGTPVPGVPGVVLKADGSYDLSGLPEAARPAVELVLKRADAEKKETDRRLLEQEKITKGIVDAREREKFIAVVKGFEGLPGVTADDLAPALREISEKCPSAYEKVMAVLKSADEAIIELDVEGVIGSSAAASGNGTAQSELEKVAKGLVEKAGAGKMTLNDAMVEAARQRPDLYRQHRQEVRDANSGATA